MDENLTFDKSSISIKSHQAKSIKQWLSSKKNNDGAEGLWRINNKLYDLINFVRRHPGGSDWLELTRGTDITELFETHHIRGKAELLLHNFYVRAAKEPRNYKFTFCEDGFYKTLKAKVADYLIVVNQVSPKKTSKNVLDSLLIVSILTAILAAKANSILLSFIAGVFMAFLGISSHNYLHQRDNWRMYCLNLTGLNYREWRVSHVISHHMYPNSLNDLELLNFEPLMIRSANYKKNDIRRVLSIFACPLLWCFFIKLTIIKRISNYFVKKCSFKLNHLITFVPPALMHIFGSNDLFVVFKIWLISLTVSSFLISFIVTTSGHHHPKVFHEGDELPKSMDFGIFQMNAVIDRKDIKENRFLNLTFGHHTLHHLFPTIDHSLLPHFNELFLDTCREFQIQLREFSWWALIAGHFQQLQRMKPISLTEMKF